MIARSLLLALLTAGLLQAQICKDSYSETHPLDPQGKVWIENENGSITLRTWDRPEVSVQVEKSASTPDYLQAIKVEISSGPEALSIKTTFPAHEFSWRDLLSWSWNSGNRGEVQLTLRVPSAARLEKISTVNGGITIEGAQGVVDVRTVNGAIRATGLHGGAFTTVNGSVHAALAAFDSDAHLDVSTVNGSVTILLPKAVGASVRLSTVNGRVSSDFPVETDGATGIFSHRLAGVIGAGGSPIKVRTVNGGVQLLRE